MAVFSRTRKRFFGKCCPCCFGAYISRKGEYGNGYTYETPSGWIAIFVLNAI